MAGEEKDMCKNTMRKRLTIAALSIIMAIMPVYASAEEEGGATESATTFRMEAEEIEVSGQGTVEAPLQIETATQLAAFAWCLNNDRLPEALPEKPQLLLANDIVLDDYALGAGWSPIGVDKNHAFQGVFDGGGLTITGLFIDRTQANVGLFGYVSGTVTNLTLESVNITKREGGYAGGIAGFADGATISHCAVSGSITGAVDSNRIGGIAGGTKGATIQSCANAAQIRQGYDVGGIVGEAEGGTILGCVNVGAVSGGTCTGGIVGNLTLDGRVSNCLNSGLIEGKLSAGGIVGSSWGRLEICMNTANITCNFDSLSRAGGIAGSLDYRSSTVNCMSICDRIRASGLRYAGCIAGTPKTPQPPFTAGFSENYSWHGTSVSNRSYAGEQRDGNGAPAYYFMMSVFLNRYGFNDAYWTITEENLPYITAFPHYAPLRNFPPTQGGSGDYEQPVLPINRAIEIPDTGDDASVAWLLCTVAAAIAGLVRLRERRIDL